MYALVEFFGGAAWTTIIALGAIFFGLLSYSEGFDLKDKIFNSILTIIGYFILVLAVRGILIWIASML